MTSTINNNNNAWVLKAENLIADFAQKHGCKYVKKKQEYFALFEIGCFLSLTRAYKKRNFAIQAKNIAEDKIFKYLTTPNGNPDNFSYIEIKKENMTYHVRQQVKILSSIDQRIYFTPDIVVISGNTQIDSKRDHYMLTATRR